MKTKSTLQIRIAPIGAKRNSTAVLIRPTLRQLQALGRNLGRRVRTTNTKSQAVLDRFLTEARQIDRYTQTLPGKYFQSLTLAR